MDQVIYKLLKPIPYSHNGETRQAQFVELREPGQSHLRGACALRQMVTQLLFGIQEHAAKQGLRRDDVISGTEVKKLHEIDPEELGSEAKQLAEMLQFAFGMTNAVQLADFVETFSGIATNSRQHSVCALDGSVPMTSALWEKVGVDDACAIAVEWCANFGMPSGFRGKIAHDKQSGSASPVTVL